MVACSHNCESGLYGRSSAQSQVLLQPPGYSAGNEMSVLPAPHAAAYLVFFSLSGNFRAFEVTEFPSFPQKCKKVLNCLTWAAWDMEPSQTWANMAWRKIAMTGSMVGLETVSKRKTLRACDSPCPFLCPFCVIVPVKTEPRLCLLPTYSHLLFLAAQLRPQSFNDYSVSENMFTLSKRPCTS